jgi:hypothetical protein
VGDLGMWIWTSQFGKQLQQLGKISKLQSPNLQFGELDENKK